MIYSAQMSKLAALWPLLLLGCGAAARIDAAPRGCPDATAVALAQWSPRTVAGSPPHRGTPKDAAWLVRLGFREVGADDAPDPGPVPGYQLAKLGLGPLPTDVWFLRPGLAPCPAKVTGYVAERVEDGVPIIRLSAVLAGCAAPADDEPWTAGWISFEGVEPVGCRLELPARIGARVGVAAADGTFAIPPLTVETTLPEVWDLAVPVADCAGCETLWSVDAVAVADPAISAVTITDVVPGIAAACELDARTSYGWFATPSAGAAPVRLDLPEAYDLAGALVDPRGTRAVLAIGVDRWAAYDLGADGALGAGRAVTYTTVSEEDLLWHSLAPYCGP